ncbi:PREDICTED: synaptotagmin-5-like [Pseudopodoces humilis]|uniref:synaptotagmin-5-like n=1 Tax=Pseudopodoces humilis TaxID=181119 RepID=UPI0006B82918|nr:PREDICTED: synaptotagmin-5-like [Pseudopodoces humilis]
MEPSTFLLVLPPWKQNLCPTLVARLQVSSAPSLSQPLPPPPLRSCPPLPARLLPAPAAPGCSRTPPPPAMPAADSPPCVRTPGLDTLRQSQLALPGLHGRGHRQALFEHLQVSLGSGLFLLCLGVLLGCAVCRWHRRRPGRPLGRQRVELGAALPAATVPVPIQQRGEELTGARAEEISPASRGGSPHGRASLPTLPFLPQLAGLWQRRCTIAGTEIPCNERSPLVPAVPGSPPRSGRRPRLHCDLRYSLPEATLTVTVLGVSQLPQGHRGSRVKVSLVSRRPSVRRRNLRREPRPCRFGPYGPEELGSCTLRFAVYTRSRSLQDSFVGEVLFPCAETSWDPRAPSSYCWELANTKTKLSKHRSAHTLSCSIFSSVPRGLGRLLLLLQHQAQAGRIKVLLRKAEALGRLSRLPGAPGHYVIVHLHHDGHIIDTKETKSASGYNPVWNAPFLFSIPAGDIQQQELALEFIVMQARLHARGSMLGRVQVGPGAPGTGMLHWRDMCSRAPLESESWHCIQPPAPGP